MGILVGVNMVIKDNFELIICIEGGCSLICIVMDLKLCMLFEFKLVMDFLVLMWIFIS